MRKRNQQLQFNDSPHSSSDDQSPWWVRWFGALILAYCLGNAGLRLLLSDSATIDEVDQIVASQWLAGGYDPTQPPLFTWLVWAVRQLVGMGTAELLAIKYSLFALTLWLHFSVACRLLSDRTMAAIATAALLLIYQIGWNLHGGFTHTMALLPALVATVWAVLRIVERPNALNFALFGVVVGFGLLSKWGYALMLVALLAAALSISELGTKVFRRWLFLSAIIATAMLSPYLAWVIHDGVGLTQSLSTELSADSGGFFSKRLNGMISLIAAMAGYLMPLVALLLILFWRALQTPSRASVPGQALLSRATVIAVGLVVFAVILFGIGGFKERWMHALLLFLPLVLFARIGSLSRSARPARRRGILLGAIGLMIVASPLVRLAEFAFGPPLCNSCRLMVDYQPLADRLRAQNLGNAAIFTHDIQTGGNLAAALPEVVVYGPDQAARFKYDSQLYDQVFTVLAPNSDVNEAELGSKGFAVQTVTTPIKAWFRAEPHRSLTWTILIPRPD